MILVRKRVQTARRGDDSGAHAVLRHNACQWRRQNSMKRDRALSTKAGRVSCAIGAHRHGQGAQPKGGVERAAKQFTENGTSG